MLTRQAMRTISNPTHTVWTGLLAGPLAGLVVTTLLSGCGETGVLTLLDPVDSTKERIVNGQVIPLTDHPAVGKLTRSGSLCTATLIGKKTVVTASHCVSPGSTHYFEVGGTKYKAAWAKRHPQYGSGYSNDIAIVMLSEEPPVEPAMMNVTAPAQGLTLTIVGFGKTNEWSNDAGTKRKTQNTASSVTSTHISFNGASGNVGNICNGDSGGPSFATLGGNYVQVGVHSTKSGTCGSGGNDIRIDAYKAWVEQTAGGDVVKPGSTPPSNPPSDPPDPSNPPGGTQPGDTSAPQVAITAPAALADVAPQLSVKTAINDNVAVTKVELHVGNNLAATLTAPPFDFAVTLPGGPQTIRVFAFDAAGNRGEASVAITVVDGSAPAPPENPPPKNAGPAAGAFGTSCSGPQDCTSGLCAADPLTGAKFCTEVCSPAASCPANATCYNTPDPQLQVCGGPQTAPGDPQLPGSPPGNGGGNGLGGGLVGGCTVAATAAPDASLLAWLGLALLFGLHRPRRRPR